MTSAENEESATATASWPAWRPGDPTRGGRSIGAPSERGIGERDEGDRFIGVPIGNVIARAA